MSRRVVIFGKRHCFFKCLFLSLPQVKFQLVPSRRRDDTLLLCWCQRRGTVFSLLSACYLFKHMRYLLPPKWNAALINILIGTWVIRRPVKTSSPENKRPVRGFSVWQTQMEFGGGRLVVSLSASKRSRWARSEFLMKKTTTLAFTRTANCYLLFLDICRFLRPPADALWGEGK